VITPAYSITATERVLPRMALDFTTGVLDPRVTLTRALNTATRVNSSGLIEVVNADLPRFDYDSITLEPKGLLIEETRVNNLTYSEQFDNVAWVKSGLNTTGTPAYIDVAVSPDGTQNADFMIEDTANSQHTTRVSASLLATTTYTYSFFVKPAGRINISTSRFNSAVVPSFAHTFTLTGSGSSSGGTVTALSNGWYRCSGSFTTTGAGVGGFVILLSDGTGTTYQGDGTSGVYIWGAQLEAGAFATSYIPTEGSAVTRNADVATMTGTNFSDWFNPTEGTFSAQFIYTGFFVANFIYCMNTPFSTTNALAAYISAPTTMRLDVLNAGTQARFASTVAPNTRINTSFAYKQDDFAGAFNGNATQTDTSGVLATGDRFSIGNRNGVNVFNGWIQKINYYPQRLTNNEVQAFSK
jgi:hypothetical protein